MSFAQKLTYFRADGHYHCAGDANGNYLGTPAEIYQQVGDYIRSGRIGYPYVLVEVMGQTPFICTAETRTNEPRRAEDVRTTDAVAILHSRYGVPGDAVRVEVAQDDHDHLSQPGVCRRCGGTFPTCCTCPDDSHWNKTLIRHNSSPPKWDALRTLTQIIEEADTVVKAPCVGRVGMLGELIGDLARYQREHWKY